MGRAYNPQAMSKAFTREETEATRIGPRGRFAVAGRRRNYMTPGGFARLTGELDQLVAQRAARARRDGRVGGRQRRPLGERRLHLRQEAPARDRPPHPLPDQAARRRRGRRPGGARADDEDDGPGLLRRDGRRARRRGEARTVTIVGVDEIDTARGYISWVSPMARALLKAREGDTVTLRTPGGAEERDRRGALRPACNRRRGRTALTSARVSVDAPRARPL